MNRIEKVSIGGYAFALDKEAYQLLQDYLDELKKHYGSSADGKEILEGIEERVAELLFEKSGKDGIVTTHYVQAAIEVLGNPAQIEEQDEAAENKDEKVPEQKPHKRLYRDTVDHVIGGVCSGLAAYFHLDAALMRIIWVVLVIVGIHLADVTNFDVLLPGIFIAYFVLWISVPSAKTVKQRLEMRGEDASAEGIRKEVESGARMVKEASMASNGTGFWATLVNIFLACVAVMLIIIGASGLFTGTMLLFGERLMHLVINNSDWFEWWNETPYLTALTTDIWTKILTCIVYFIPFIGMIYGGVMMLFKFKTPSWRPGLWLFIFWLLSVIALAIVVGFYMTAHFLSI